MSNSENQESVRRRAWVPLQHCPMARAAEIIGDRWVLLILREAAYGVIRYDDILNDIGAPRSVLTNRLKQMLNHRLIEKRPYREPGARTRNAYVLTEKGKGLMLTLLSITEWGEAHVLGRPALVEVRARGTDRKLRVALVDESGTSVPISDVYLARRSEQGD